MSTRWRVVDLLDYSGDVDTRPGRIVAGGQEFPLADVGCILVGTNTHWSTGVVAKAAKYDVPILVCDWRGVPLAVVTPWSSNTRVGARHLAQADLSQPKMKNAWMRIVQAKIRGQAANLPGGKTRDELLELARTIRSGDPLNYEARAARMYWSRLFTDDFTRDRDGDGKNVLLNYGYAILRGMTVRAICAAGLSPTLGVFHRHRANPFALADDLMEPFRPAVDHVAASLPGDAVVSDPEVKRALVGVLAVPMNGVGASVATAISDLAQDYANYVEGDRDKVTVPVWSPAHG